MTNCSTQYLPLLMLLGGGTAQNPVCDLCSMPSDGTILAAADIRHAIVDKGFNPFLKIPVLMGKIMGTDPEIHLQNLKSLLSFDTSDWNICPACMKALADELPPPSSPTGARMSITPVSVTVADAGGTQ